MFKRRALLGIAMFSNSLLGSPGPQPSALPAKIEEPQDRPYPGSLPVSAQATSGQRA